MAEQGEAQQQQQLQVTGRIVAYPEAFADGDVERWLRHFDTCATANGWGDATKGRVAPTYLKGRAWTVYERLTVADAGTYPALSEALKRVFSPNTAERRRLARKQFHDRVWRSPESLELYARDLERRSQD